MHGGKRGQKRTVTDPLGNQSEEILDTLGNMIKITKKDGAGHLLTCDEASYDGYGRKVLERAVVIASDASSRAYEKEYSFNQREQLASILGKNTPEERITRFEYNSHGELSAKFEAGSAGPITYRYGKETLNVII